MKLPVLADTGYSQMFLERGFMNNWENRKKAEACICTPLQI